jgi:hypothetical protein
MPLLDRRRISFSTAVAIITVLFDRSASARSNAEERRMKWTYRGFTVDHSEAQNLSDIGSIEASVKHQIDIAVDCGADPKIIEFFKSQEVTLKLGEGHGGGHFNFSVDEKGVAIDAAVQPPQRPILLHELLHAFHFRMLHDSLRNPDLLRFYGNAVRGGLYPPDSYVLSNVREFFAVTGSLYLWGNVDRPPHTRAVLRAKQPYYYRWLGELFGVQKDS